MASPAASMPVGQCAFLKRADAMSTSDLAQITPPIPQRALGHPCIILKHSSNPSAPTARVLITLISSFGCSSRGDTTPPWKRPHLARHYPDPTVLRAGADCHSQRPDPSRPFIQLKNGEHFDLPTWTNVTQVYAVPVACLKTWQCNSHKQVTAESVADLLQHSAKVTAPSRLQAVHKALNATVPTPSSGLPTPPSTPPPKQRQSTAAPSPAPSRQVNQPWRPLTPPSTGTSDNNKRKRRTSSNGDHGSKAPKLTPPSPPKHSPKSPKDCAVSSDKESDDGWTTVKSKKNKK
ncbi:hypothetical protein B0T21DRAFT_345054 [Apiosordaria backusii]|uniref:Uncharacterized protein n=1 Tax=Apiosordaria backusii TaxID=314023 RepID=A0AA40K438_9PEZI|nr:hypothetical protein B0T21DRAFT_345054 [Apiosordaria backusii]